MWARVRATVRPIDPQRRAPATPLPVTTTRSMAVPPPIVTIASSPGSPPGTTLDRSWDRRLATGGVMPDMTIDLHGHTLASAHAALDHGLARALSQGARVVLLVTGRAPRPDSLRPHARGAIRASIDDWLRLSRHAGRIAAVRGAHPRHGGAGALYLILRRPR